MRRPPALIAVSPSVRRAVQVGVRAADGTKWPDDTGVIIGSLDVHQLDAPCIPLTPSKRLLVWTSAVRPIRR